MSQALLDSPVHPRSGDENGKKPLILLAAVTQAKTAEIGPSAPESGREAEPHVSQPQQRVRSEKGVEGAASASARQGE